MSQKSIIWCAIFLVLVAVSILTGGVILGHQGMASTGIELTKTVFSAMVGAVATTFGSKKK